MTDTALAFEDDGVGFKKGDKVRIIAGENAGKFGTIDDDLVSGYYVVIPDGETRPAILETTELEPIVEPRLVLGMPVPSADLDTSELAAEVAATVTRLSTRVNLTGPQVAASPEALIGVLVTDLDEVILTAIETQVRLRRKLAEMMGAK